MVPNPSADREDAVDAGISEEAKNLLTTVPTLQRTNYPKPSLEWVLVKVKHLIVVTIFLCKKASKKKVALDSKTGPRAVDGAIPSLGL